MPPFSSSSLVAALTATLAVTATSLVVASPASAASRQEEHQGKQTNVYVQGDSLTVGVSDPLRRQLGPDVKNLGIDAQVGRFTATGMNRLGHDNRARQSKVWVLALGTNDGPNPSALRKQVERSLRMAGQERQVIWLTIKRPGGYQPVNRMLKSLDDRHENLHVVDWAMTAHKHPGLISGDGVHATSHGYQRRARMIADAALPLARVLPESATREKTPTPTAKPSPSTSGSTSPAPAAASPTAATGSSAMPRP